MLTLILVLVFFVIAGAGIIGCVVFGAQSTLDRWRMARRGLGHFTPACRHCLYEYQGWAGPTCPECGHDAQVHGVRIGSVASRALFASIHVLIGFGLVFPIGLLAWWFLLTDGDWLWLTLLPPLVYLGALARTIRSIDSGVRTIPLTSQSPSSVRP